MSTYETVCGALLDADGMRVYSKRYAHLTSEYLHGRQYSVKDVHETQVAESVYDVVEYTLDTFNVEPDMPQNYVWTVEAILTVSNLNEGVVRRTVKYLTENQYELDHLTYQAEGHKLDTTNLVYDVIDFITTEHNWL